jgi:hypothetical protein
MGAQEHVELLGFAKLRAALSEFRIGGKTPVAGGRSGASYWVVYRLLILGIEMRDKTG